MDMRNQAERAFRVDLRHLDGYCFESRASEDGRPHGEPFLSDEPDPVGAASAPATPALLAAASGTLPVGEPARGAAARPRGGGDYTTEVTAIVRPNADGLPRIDHVDVVLKPLVVGESGRTRRCEEVFERHCTVTSSVRTGIDVRVEVDWTVLAAEDDQPRRVEAAAAPLAD